MALTSVRGEYSQRRGKMVEGLMHICQRWGNLKCNTEVAELKYPKRMEPGEPIPLWPCGPELKQIDDICKGCEESAFEIDEPKCPVCETHNLQPGKVIKSMAFGPVKPSHKVFLYGCHDCNRYLTSHLDFS
jgi:hypothetical protein